MINTKKLTPLDTDLGNVFESFRLLTVEVSLLPEHELTQ